MCSYFRYLSIFLCLIYSYINISLYVSLLVLYIFLLYSSTFYEYYLETPRHTNPQTKPFVKLETGRAEQIKSVIKISWQENLL